MTALIAWFSPTRWAILAGVLLALIAALWGIHAHGVGQGRAEIQARWETAKAQATAAQAAQVEAAEKTLIQEVEVIRTVYRDRIKKVIEYAPTPGTQCPADPDFVRLYNNAAR